MDAYTVTNKFFKKIREAQILDKKYQALKDIEKNKAKRSELKTEVIKLFSDCIDYIQLTFKKGRTNDELITFIAYVADMVGDGVVKAKLKNNETKHHKIYKLNTSKGNFEIHLIKEVQPYMTGENGQWLINPVSITRATI